MDTALRFEVEDFLYAEADLLDERRYHDWVALFTDDVRYFMPVRHNPYGRPNEVADELSKPGETAYYDETKETLQQRVQRLYSKAAWSELPPSRTRHLVSNIRIKNATGAELTVHSNFVVYRTRLERAQDIFVGTRQDRYRRIDGQLRISHRTIILDQATLASNNISFFF
jgi:3-phenylpropionate/cinnamic acid dioxygenase small subunit